jgi:hypothetical protein
MLSKVALHPIDHLCAKLLLRDLQWLQIGQKYATTQVQCAADGRLTNVNKVHNQQQEDL